MTYSVPSPSLPVNTVNRMVRMGFKVIPEWKKYRKKKGKIKNSFRRNEIQDIVNDTRALISYLRSQESIIEAALNYRTADEINNIISDQNEFLSSFLITELNELENAGIRSNSRDFFHSLIARSRAYLSDALLSSYNLSGLQRRLSNLETQVDTLNSMLDSLEIQGDSYSSSESKSIIQRQAKNLIHLACGICVLDVDVRLEEQPVTSATSSYISFGILDYYISEAS